MAALDTLLARRSALETGEPTLFRVAGDLALFRGTLDARHALVRVRESELLVARTLGGAVQALARHRNELVLSRLDDMEVRNDVAAISRIERRRRDAEEAANVPPSKDERNPIEYV